MAEVAAETKQNAIVTVSMKERINEEAFPIACVAIVYSSFPHVLSRFQWQIELA